MEWYEQWFDTEYYHLLYQNRDETEAHDFLEKLTAFLRIPKGARIIDIACGRGRHSRYLNQMGHEVTGIDLSRNSIDYARKFENDRLRFFCFDKRKTLKAGHFDYAFNLFTSFGYVRQKSELSAALSNMVKNLKKTGIFVIDHMNAHLVRRTLPFEETITKHPYRFDIRKELMADKVVKTISVHEGRQVQCFREEVHLITIDQFRELFKESGLKILHTFGDYQLRPYEASTSDRLIIIGIKD